MVTLSDILTMECKETLKPLFLLVCAFTNGPQSHLRLGGFHRGWRGYTYRVGAFTKTRGHSGMLLGLTWNWKAFIETGVFMNCLKNLPKIGGVHRLRALWMPQKHEPEGLFLNAPSPTWQRVVFTDSRGFSETEHVHKCCHLTKDWGHL